MSDDRDVGLLQTFLSLGPDTKDCFRLFARSGNQPGCLVLGWWASFVAKEYIKSSAVLKSWSNGSESVDVVSVNDAMCKEIIRDCLLRRKASVEFYERSAAGGSYACVQRGSPGNTSDFEATLFEFEEVDVQLMSSGSLVLQTSGSAADGGVRVGFASLNTTLRQINFSEYVDTPMLSSLDALITQTNLKELTLCTVGGLKDVEEEILRALERMCERAGATLITRSLKDVRQEQKDSATVDTLDTLKLILRVPEDRMILQPYKLATHALENILLRVDAHERSNQAAFYLRHIAPSTYLKLDSAAIEALNLVSKKPEPKGTLPVSIYTWLNRCYTGMGARAMRQWLLQPLRLVDDINQRLNMVEIFVENPALRDMLISDVLKRCSDMDRLNRKLQRRSLSLKDTQAYLNFVNLIPTTINVLKTFKGQQAKLLTDECVAPLEDISEHLSNLQVLIESTVDFSDRSAARMNPSFDDELQELYDQLVQVQKGIDKEYSNVLNKYDWNEKQLKCEHHSTYGYVFRVSRKEDRQLRSSKELITVSTSKDGVRFVSDKLSSLSDQYKKISDEYDSRQQELKKKLVDTIASYLPVLDDAKEILAQLDVYTAWALVVKDSARRMVRPTLHQGDAEGPILSLTNVRHPLVELRQPNFVPNSVQLTRDANGLIITGPNMGGKSTYMRSVGIAVVLAQAGCFVPADAAELHVRDAVMCRVGATDHLAQGVSTFMVEMLESSAILTSATPQTLAIVDELGRGTSTYDGFGLAWAIAREVAEKIRATLLFSTHFHELTQLPAQCTQLRNAHFGAEVNEAESVLKFSYRLEPGPCERSYGIYVAALAHLPEDVVENAKKKAQEFENFEKNDIGVEVKKLSGDVTARIASYAKRIRELESDGAPQEEAKKRLREEIQHDAAVSSVLA